MSKKETSKEQEQIEVKNVKHTFTLEERDEIGGRLAMAQGAKRGIENEFDQVRASFKARVTECESKIDRLSTDRMNGFEMRDKRCVIRFRPEQREKDFYIESEWEAGENLTPVLTEPMTQRDFQRELVLAESKFDLREEIALFKPVENDAGVLAVGKLAGKWFSALRVKIGKLELNERLDGEQRAFKARPDAVAHAVKRFKEWAKENLKDLSDGFSESADYVAAEHKERAE